VHGNHNFFGIIEINNDYGEQFEETSSREGLLKNQTFEELTDFGYKVLTDAVLKIASVREVKQKTNQKEWKKEPEKVIEQTINELEEEIQNEEDIETVREKVKEASRTIKRAKEQQKINKIELIKELNLLRVLAGLGLTIGEFIHEIKQYQGALQHDIKNIENSSSLEKVLEVNRRVKSNLNGLATYISYFDESFSENVQRELKPIELRTVVHGTQKKLGYRAGIFSKTEKK